MSKKPILKKILCKYSSHFCCTVLDVLHSYYMKFAEAGAACPLSAVFVISSNECFVVVPMHLLLYPYYQNGFHQECSGVQ